MYNTYEKGDTVRIDIDIKVSGSYIDPTYLSLEITDPFGYVSNFIYGATGTFVRDGTGQYYLDYFAGSPGQYKRRVFASGTASAADIDYFVVRRD